MNVKNLVLLKNVRDKNQSLYLARQVHPEGNDSLHKEYVDATRRPHLSVAKYITRYTWPTQVSNMHISDRISYTLINVDD